MLAQLAAQIDVDLERLEQTIRDVDTIGPFLDPTAYLRGRHRVDDQARLMEFAAPFIRKSRELLADVRVQDAQRLTGRKP